MANVKITDYPELVTPVAGDMLEIVDDPAGVPVSKKIQAGKFLFADGTIPLTGDWDIGNGRKVRADKIQARDGDGLYLVDDGDNGIFVKDGGYVGIGTIPDELLHLKSSVSNKPVLKLENTNANNTCSQLQFYKTSASPANWDELGRLRFYGLDDGSNITEYVRIQTSSGDIVDGNEDGYLQIQLMKDGTLRSYIKLSTAEMVFNDDAQDIDFRVEGDSNVNLIKADAGKNTVGVGVIAQVASQLFAVSPDAQAVIYTAVYGYAISDAINNHGVFGHALGGGGTNNYGVFAKAENASGNNHHFRDHAGNFSDAAGWTDVSDRDMKDLIHPMLKTEIDQIYTDLDSLNVQAYVYKQEIPIIGHKKEMRQAVGPNDDLLWDSKPGKPIYNRDSEHVADEPDIQIPLMEKIPIFDEPEAAPQRYGLLADEVPDHMASKDKKGISAGRVNAALVVVCQKQKELIIDLTNRVTILEEV